jgi:hypothetical protein
MVYLTIDSVKPVAEKEKNREEDRGRGRSRKIKGAADRGR